VDRSLRFLSRLIFAIVLAFGLHFRPFGLYLGLRPQYTAQQGSTALHYAVRCVLTARVAWRVSRALTRAKRRDYLNWIGYVSALPG